ncbi:MAG: hypothetical protein WC405_18415 [Syntrophales bacterium]
MKTLKTVQNTVSPEEIKGTYVLFRDLGASFGEAISGTYASVTLSANYINLINPYPTHSNLVIISEKKLFGRPLSEGERGNLAKKA